MSAEQRKVLEMLAEGKITPEEAERLLHRLGSPAAPDDAPESEAAGAADKNAKGEGRSQAPRFLRIVVDSPNRDSVNIRLPVGLIRTGLKLPVILPGKVSRRLSERGIDFSRLGKLDEESLLAELAALQIDIADDDGEKVRIFCE